MHVEDAALIAEKVTPEQLKNAFWKALSFFASSVYFSNIPIIIFLVYMHKNGFFSYDFYEKGLFGMKAFFGFLVLMILITAFALYAFVLPLMKWKIKKKLDIGALVGASILSGIMWVFFGLVAYLSEWLDWQRLFYIGAVCLLVIIHIGSLLYAAPKFQFVSLSVVILLSLSLTINLRDAAASLVGTALKGFGSGGHACVAVTDTEDSYHLNGTLVLAAPDYIYVQQAGKASITAVKVDSKTLYSVEGGNCGLQKPEE